jgi:hypothetical protein
MPETNWEERGIVWIEEEVSERVGPNGSDTRVLGKAQIPQVVDLQKFVAAYGEGVVLGSLDGTSVRVMAQDVNRTGLRKHLSVEEIRQRIDGRLRGVRARGVPAVKVVEVKVHALPDGTTYSGTDEVEYQQAYLAALVDAGVDAAVARTIATQQHLA